MQLSATKHLTSQSKRSHQRPSGVAPHASAHLCGQLDGLSRAVAREAGQEEVLGLVAAAFAARYDVVQGANVGEAEGAADQAREAVPEVDRKPLVVADPSPGGLVRRAAALALDVGHDFPKLESQVSAALIAAWTRSVWLRPVRVLHLTSAGTPHRGQPTQRTLSETLLTQPSPSEAGGQAPT